MTPVVGNPHSGDRPPAAQSQGGRASCRAAAGWTPKIGCSTATPPGGRIVHTWVVTPRRRVAPWVIFAVAISLPSTVLFAALGALIEHFGLAGDPAVPWSETITVRDIASLTIFGVIVGLGMGLWYRRQQPISELAPLSRAQRRQAAHAARKGSAPADPALRAAALNLARQEQDSLATLRIPTLILFTPLALVSLVMAMAGDFPLGWFGAIFSATIVVATLRGPSRTQKRLDQVSEEPNRR